MKTFGLKYTTDHLSCRSYIMSQIIYGSKMECIVYLNTGVMIGIYI